MENAELEKINLKLSDLIKEIEIYIGNNFVGAYLHGSLAMGCFNTDSSDIDLIIVVKDKLVEQQKNKIGGLFINYQKKLSNKLEVSVVTISACKDLAYPPQYEIYFPDSNGNFKTEANDTDLISDFVIIKKFGIVIKGEPIERVFSVVPDDLYFKAIIKDFEWSYKNVIGGEDEGECKIPIYATLNFCRALAFFRDRLVVSKKKGGEWGLNNLPHQYIPLIREALKEYALTGSSNFVDARLLKDFANYVRSELQLN